MRKYLFVIVFLATISIAFSAYYFSMWSPIAITVTTTDTSSTKSLQGAEYAELVITTTGSDSLQVEYWLDALYKVYGRSGVEDRWVNVAADTLQSGALYKVVTIREGETTDLAPGTEMVRLVTKTTVIGDSAASMYVGTGIKGR